MAGPWEKYAAPESGPWAKFAEATPSTETPATAPKGLLPGYENQRDVPEWAGRYPNTFGAYGAARSIVRPVIEGIGTAAGGIAGALAPVPGASLAGAGAGYAASKRGADYLLGEQSDNSAMGIGKDVAIGGAMQGLGNVVSKGVGAAMPQSWIDKLYASSLKLSTSPRVLPIAERNAVIRTGLREKSVPNVKGYEKIVDKIDDLGDAVSDTVANSNGYISANDVATRLDDLLLKGDIIKKGDPGFKNAVLKVKDELLDPNTPDMISVQDAQKIKQHIYKVYRDSYGVDDYTAAYVQGKKAVARGLKEEIEAIHPEVKDLNMSQKELLDFLDPFGRAVARIQNRDIVGLGMQTAPVVGHMVSGGSPVASAAAMAAKLIDTPVVKARLAILLNNPTGPTRQAIGKAIPAVTPGVFDFLSGKP